MINSLFYTLSLTLIALTFLLSSIKTLQNWQDTVGMMKAKALPQPNLLLALATILKITAGLMLLFQYQVSLAAIGLLFFTAMATLIFDNFWSATGMERTMRYFGFLSNLSIMGGLLLVSLVT
jgi:putative oxidoreductase